MDMQAKQLYCVIGQPLGHSLSPLLHNTAFAETGLPGVYMAFPQTGESLPGFFAGLRALPISGCNVTLPFKVRVMDFLDDVTPRARRVGAVNTIFWKDGRLTGENTDVTGFAAPLKGRSFRHGLIFGAGGVSRAAIVALEEMGVGRITITNRTLSRARDMADEFGIDCLPWEERGLCDCDLAVNATSLGMQGEREAQSPCDAAFFQGRQGLAYDIIYTPRETVFLRQAKQAGWQTQDGAAMFVEQGRAAFELWTGTPMPEGPAYACIDAALAARG